MNTRTFIILLASTILAIGQETSSTIKNISPAKAAKAIKADPNIVVIDIRTSKEFNKGHIAKAKNIDFQSLDFAKKLAKLDRKKTYLVHCKSGGRSTRSLAIWKKLGFKNVLHLDTGILGWQQVNLAITKPKKK